MEPLKATLQIYFIKKFVLNTTIKNKDNYDGNKNTPNPNHDRNFVNTFSM